MGVGAALLPQSEITREHGSYRPLVGAGAPVEIAYEAGWDNDTPLAADLEYFVAALTRHVGEGSGN